MQPLQTRHIGTRGLKSRIQEIGSSRRKSPLTNGRAPETLDIQPNTPSRDAELPLRHQFKDNRMFSKRSLYPLLVLGAVSILGGCQSAAIHRDQVQDNSADRVTVGKVQKEIRVGMSGAEVAQALGSPNIVSTDEERREVWIYDKIATDRAYSSSSGGVNSLILGFGAGAAGGLGGGFGSAAGASSTSQRTLTVIVKFDTTGKVRDFAYHTSRF